MLVFFSALNVSKITGGSGVDHEKFSNNIKTSKVLFVQIISLVNIMIIITSIITNIITIIITISIIIIINIINIIITIAWLSCLGYFFSFSFFFFFF